MPDSDVQTFEFQREHDGSLDLHGAVFQALGAASMCWENIEGAGVFQSERAGVIGDALIEFIERRYGPLVTALILTQEYFGSERLPPNPGWSWYDALTAFYGEPFVPADRRPGTPPAGDDSGLTAGP